MCLGSFLKIWQVLASVAVPGEKLKNPSFSKILKLLPRSWKLQNLKKEVCRMHILDATPQNQLLGIICLLIWENADLQVVN